MMILLNIYPESVQKSFCELHVIHATANSRSSNQLNERGYAR